MDDNQRETISKLKFLGKIKKGEKINVKEMTLQTESYLTAASRTIWFVDNRNNTMSFIQTTIQAGFDLLHLLNKNTGNVSDDELSKTIVKDISNAKVGINNLKTTYSDDTYFCCSVDTFVETITAKLLDLRDKRPSIFVVEDKDLATTTFVEEKKKKKDN